MNSSAEDEPLTIRRAQPIHYAAIVVYLALCGAVIAVFGLRSALGFMRAVVFAVCTFAGIQTLWLAITGFQKSVFRTGLGLIERHEKPAMFWGVLLLDVLCGPALIGAFAALTRDW